MYFTRTDILTILRALLQLGIKDSEFKNANLPLQDLDFITVVQNGANRKVSVNDIIGQFNLLNRQDFINVSDMYDEYYITINEAIKLLPNRKRKKGLVITFLTTNGKWQIYLFKGDIKEFVNPSLWEDLFGLEYLIIDSIVPDEEDLTISKPNESGNSLLSFKDKEYDPEGFSGMATKILRKNIKLIDGIKKNLLTQEDFNKENCIYEIRYDFDLNGEAITIPKSILKFNGGTISNGTLIGQYPTLNLSSSNICFNNITFSGNWDIDYINVKALGAIGDGVNDDSKAIQGAISLHNRNNRRKFTTIYFPKGNYLVTEIFNIYTYSLKLLGTDATILNKNILDKPIFNFLGSEAVVRICQECTDISINFNSVSRCLSFNFWTNIYIHDCNFTMNGKEKITDWSEDISFSFAISLSYVSFSKIENIYFNCTKSVGDISLSLHDTDNFPTANSLDGIHLFCGCHDIYIKNVFGITGDDFIALNASEGTKRDYKGISNITIDNVHLGNKDNYSLSGIRIYAASTDDLYIIENINIINSSIYSNTPPIYITNNAGVIGSSSNLKVIVRNIKIDNCDLSLSNILSEVWGPGRIVYSPLCIALYGCDIYNFIISNCRIVDQGNQGDFIGIYQFTNINSLYIDNINIESTITTFIRSGFPASIKSDTDPNNSAVIKEITIANTNFNNKIKYIFAIVNSKQINTLQLNNLFLDNILLFFVGGDNYKNIFIVDTLIINNIIFNAKITASKNIIKNIYFNNSTFTGSTLISALRIDEYIDTITTLHNLSLNMLYNNIINGYVVSYDTYIPVNDFSTITLVNNGKYTMTIGSHVFYFKVYNKILITENYDNARFIINTNTKAALDAVISENIIIALPITMDTPYVFYNKSNIIFLENGSIQSSVKLRGNKLYLNYKSLEERLPIIADGSTMYNVGTTSLRTYNPEVGHEFFDTTLNKKIVWNGEAWVNMDGTSL